MALDPKHVEGAVLLYVAERHPKHLTASALAREMASLQGEGEQITSAIQALKSSGLLREKEGVIELTRPALHATSILTL